MYMHIYIYIYNKYLKEKTKKHKQNWRRKKKGARYKITVCAFALFICRRHIDLVGIICQAMFHENTFESFIRVNDNHMICSLMWCSINTSLLLLFPQS